MIFPISYQFKISKKLEKQQNDNEFTSKRENTENLIF